MGFRIGLLLTLSAAVFAAPEPGVVPFDDVPVGKLRFPVRDGDEALALKTFLEAHAKHKAGDEVAARKGYVAFLGMPGRHVLPGRYREMARARLQKMDLAADRAFDDAAKLYRKDGAAGLAAFEKAARDFEGLPSGRRAQQMVESDKLKRAIEAATKTAKSDKKAAAAALKKAVRACPEAVYRYKALKLLLELGGPDLRTPEERLEGTSRRRDDDDEDADSDDDDNGDIVIEEGDG